MRLHVTSLSLKISSKDELLQLNQTPIPSLRNFVNKKKLEIELTKPTILYQLLKLI